MRFPNFSATRAAAQQSLPTIDVGGQRRGVSAWDSTRRRPGDRHKPGSEPVRSAFAAIDLGGDASRRQAGLRSEVAIAQHGRERHASADQPQNQHRRHGRRGQIHAEPVRAQTQQRRHSGGFADAHLGRLSSARSLVYADDLLLTALIGNDNTIGAPRWGLVAPEEIERVDFLYGPFAAQYPGNSLGGVLKITTRMPEKLEVSVRNTTTIQDFSQWGTSRGFVNNVSSFFIGDKVGDFLWTVSGNWQRGSQQPLTYVTTAPTSFYSRRLSGDERLWHHVR